MTRQELTNQYELDPHGIIASPGKFEGEPLYVPYYWQCYLDGMADSDDGKILYFDVTDDDRKEFSELAEVKTVELWESDNGFVFHDAIGHDHKPVNA